jgi:hypothetical protein
MGEMGIIERGKVKMGGVDENNGVHGRDGEN